MSSKVKQRWWLSLIYLFLGHRRFFPTGFPIPPVGCRRCQSWPPRAVLFDDAKRTADGHQAAEGIVGNLQGAGVDPPGTVGPSETGHPEKARSRSGLVEEGLMDLGMHPIDDAADKKPAWYHFAPHHQVDIHLYLLASHLAWPHGWDALAEAIEQLHRLAVHDDTPICMGSEGQWELIVHPEADGREILFTLVPNLPTTHHINDLEGEIADYFLMLIGGNGRGPTSVDEMTLEMCRAMTRARKRKRPVAILRHLGLCNPIIYPDGTLRLFETRPAHAMFRAEDQGLSSFYKALGS